MGSSKAQLEVKRAIPCAASYIVCIYIIYICLSIYLYHIYSILCILYYIYYIYYIYHIYIYILYIYVPRESGCPLLSGAADCCRFGLDRTGSGTCTWLLSRTLQMLAPPSTQLPLKRSQISSNRDHKALNRGTLGGVGHVVVFFSKTMIIIIGTIAIIITGVVTLNRVIILILGINIVIYTALFLFIVVTTVIMTMAMVMGMVMMMRMMMTTTTTMMMMMMMMMILILILFLICIRTSTTNSLLTAATVILTTEIMALVALTKVSII